MAARPMRVFNIPFGASFLDALVDALLTGPLSRLIDFAGDPLAVASAVIHVPTRRAGRALAGKLATRLGGRAVLLPRILPLGETEALEYGLIGDPGGLALDEAPIGEMQRRLLLAKLVSRWSGEVDRATLRLWEEEAFAVAAGPASVMSLAGDLARLIDGLHAEGVPLAALTRLDAAEFQEMWRISATFLAIAGATWPAMLAERRRLDPADRHGRVVEAYARRLAAEGSSHPVIAVGSTGSIEATAALLEAIAGMPNGAVVLTGIDRELDDRYWSLLDGPTSTPSHPQHALRRLLDRLGMAPGEVEDIDETPGPLRARGRLLAEAMRPAETTEAWSALAASAPTAHVAPGLEGVAVIEAPDERLEALAIALVLREAIEAPAQVAALITPDRGLAERVTVELARWGITADDSAGSPLSRTQAGRLALTLAELAGPGFSSGALIALLRHPMASFGLERSVLERGAAAIDIALLRGRRIGDMEGLRKALAEAQAEGRQHASRPRARLGTEDFAAAALLVDAVLGAIEPLRSATGGRRLGLPRLAEAHAEALRLVTRRADETDGFAGPGAEEMVSLFADLAECLDEGPELGIEHYPQTLRALMEERSVTPASLGHRRVKIWGLLEARLLEADMAVLGGLVEGTWPAAIATDPFINRGMRAQLGLTPPERRIGQMAHDFVAACGARRCVLARPLKSQGADTIPSRFLQRLQAVAGKPSFEAAKLRGERYLRLAALLDDPGPIAPVPQPSPMVVARLQPLQLSVTAIETLLRDPYAIFARHVLGLDRLDPIGLAFDPRLQGTVWHAALADFTTVWPSALPRDALDEVLRIGRALISPHMQDPEVESFVWPRFRRAAQWYVEWERRRRGNISRILVETSSALALTLEDGAVFRLTARPDRVERLVDGTLAIVDFKTGSPPSHADVLSGFSPQLTLEAAILAEGGMESLPPGIISELCHVALSGGNPPGREQPVRLKEAHAVTLGEIAFAHLDGLRRVLGDYRRGQRGFSSKPFPSRMPAFSDYDHLARFAEWSDEGGEEAEAP